MSAATSRGRAAGRSRAPPGSAARPAPRRRKPYTAEVERHRDLADLVGVQNRASSPPALIRSTRSSGTIHRIVHDDGDGRGAAHHAGTLPRRHRLRDPLGAALHQVRAAAAISSRPAVSASKPAERGERFRLAELFDGQAPRAAASTAARMPGLLAGPAGDARKADCAPLPERDAARTDGDVQARQELRHVGDVLVDDNVAAGPDRLAPRVRGGYDDVDFRRFHEPGGFQGVEHGFDPPAAVHRAEEDKHACLVTRPASLGHGTCTSWQIKTLFMQEMLARGILIQGSHNFSFAHGDAEIDTLLAAYDEVLPIMKDAVHSSAMEGLLQGPLMQPLFQVR